MFYIERGQRVFSEMSAMVTSLVVVKQFIVLSRFCFSDINRTRRILLAQEYLTNPLLISNR